MTIQSLQLLDFRNYESLSLSFGEGRNILYGDNGQGKTNLLEAIYLAGTTKSHRGSKDREMIRLGKEEAHIRLWMEEDRISHRIDLHLKQNKAKGAAIDGLSVHRAGELIGFLKIVFFSPEDLNLLKRGPGERRRFLDMELCQLDRVYLNDLSMYNRALVQRNQLLKQISFQPSLQDTLPMWEEQLDRYGSRLIQRRQEFISACSQLVTPIHDMLSGGRERLILQYEPNVREEFGQILALSRDRDLMQKQTTRGPHRDDMCFSINDQDARKYGSQGQQRTAALSLKMAEIQMVRQRTGKQPILLLDDVLSELDRKRQNALMEEIGSLQVILTCTGLEEFILNRSQEESIFHVAGGKVEIQKGGSGA